VHSSHPCCQLPAGFHAAVTLYFAVVANVSIASLNLSLLVNSVGFYQVRRTQQLQQPGQWLAGSNTRHAHGVAGFSGRLGQAQTVSYREPFNFPLPDPRSCRHVLGLLCSCRRLQSC
jgi:hypothetical protein